jgi:hypothetical protein
MTQVLLTPPSSRLLQDTDCCNVIRESEPLPVQVLNEERELVIVDNNTREVCDADVEQASTRVADNADLQVHVNCFIILFSKDHGR